MATQVGRVEGRQRREEKTSVGGDKSGILPQTLQLVGSVRVPKRGSWGPQNVVAARPLLLGDRAAMSLA